MIDRYAFEGAELAAEAQKWGLVMGQTLNKRRKRARLGKLVECHQYPDKGGHGGMDGNKWCAGRIVCIVIMRFLIHIQYRLGRRLGLMCCVFPR